MSQPPLVSIMLPARDAASTLLAAGRSCLNQSYSRLELLLVANDSTEDTLQVMQTLEAEDSRARIVHAPDGAGFIPALNLAWQTAKGELLARMDADDISYPERIAAQVAHLQEHPELAATCSQVRILRRLKDGTIEPPLQGYADFERWLNATVTPEQIAAERFVDSPVANPSAMIRRSVFEQIGGYRDLPWAEDYDFWLRMLEAGLPIGKVDSVLLDWFDGETRLTRNDERYSQDHFLEAKAHFLARMELVKERGILLCGAGPIGKRLGRLLQAEGVTLKAFLEVSQKRIGNEIAGVPVLGSEALPISGQPVAISAVGLPGARDQIREMLRPHGYIEGQDFYCAA